MENKFTFFVQSKKDAMFLINSLDEIQLPLLALNCIVPYGQIYGVWYDSTSNYVMSSCYPYHISIRNSIKDTFKFVIDSYYPGSL